MPDLAPYVPAITAFFTLANTIILVWNHRKVSGVKQQVNGMKWQLLADAENRGRQQALSDAQIETPHLDVNPPRRSSSGASRAQQSK
jgi:hypothetical protein